MSLHAVIRARAALPLRVLSIVALAAAPLAAPVRAAPAVSTIAAFSLTYPNGNIVKGDDGAYYGTSASAVSATGGLIYRFLPDGTSIKTLYQLGKEDGVSPVAGLLIGSDHRFYGVTKFGKSGPTATQGTVFSVKQDGTDYVTLHRFADATGTNIATLPINTDGAQPVADLIESTLDGFLYGTTQAGGAGGTGAIFKIRKDGTGFQLLHAFGAITSAADAGYRGNADGLLVLAPLAEGAPGVFYGVASQGGANGRGTIFRVNYDGTGFSVVYVFPAATADTTTGLFVNAQGVYPSAGLVDTGNNVFYGSTSQGGSHGDGVLFRLSTDGTNFEVLHEFDGKGGSGPAAELTLGLDGLLYGTTRSGGVNSSDTQTSFGTIFSIAGDGTGFTRLHSFDGSSGYAPATRLVQVSSDVLIGTVESGGKCGYGGLYSYSASGATVTGDTKCGNKKNNGYGSGGGGSGPAVLLLLVGLGLARRRLLPT